MTEKITLDFKAPLPSDFFTFSCEIAPQLKTMAGLSPYPLPWIAAALEEPSTTNPLCARIPFNTVTLNITPTTTLQELLEQSSFLAPEWHEVYLNQYNAEQRLSEIENPRRLFLDR